MTPASDALAQTGWIQVACHRLQVSPHRKGLERPLDLLGFNLADDPAPTAMFSQSRTMLDARVAAAPTGFDMVFECPRPELSTIDEKDLASSFREGSFTPAERVTSGLFVQAVKPLATA